MTSDASLFPALGGAPETRCATGARPQPQFPSTKPGNRDESNLAGLHILVVEDEFLVALEVEAALERMGCSIVGPFARLAKALEAARNAPLDGAVLDINLNGEMVYPLAELLVGQSVPFVFITGYAAADLPENFRPFRRLQKPLDAEALRKAFLDMRLSEH